MFDGSDLKNLFSLDGFLKTIQFEPEYIREGEISIIVPLRNNLLRIGEIMNGGAVMAISDAIGGLSAMTYPGIVNQVTVSFNTEFMRPIAKGPVRFISRVDRIGKSIAYVEVLVYDGENLLSSKSTGVYFLYRS
ncbi:hypothetical protein [Thermoplasma volcanium GSS1]|uniref:Putative esterase TV1331 n=1 Tax=Thermoplasma volcanium (strain ATCC 51530 / DSM 4299 / JCM 9571 / NBRC 15438 / GSS1) TaxID=273116 RepID=Y1331_THEVO|nr:PaaI family thioesterase [Thermoplasma volcanium]Q978T4.1 RecName: Full=Putative esterase TV1331 [Thermoplasma volcanium GSS1]BAB60473.1 hypothetical protein [Thermoplasma volcanium GSS1]